MSDYIFLILAIFLMIIGIIGCLVPVLPGPPISFLGLLLLHASKFGNFSLTTIVIFLVVTIVVTILDYIVPVWGAKKFGGSRAGVWGSVIGLIIGIFFLPLGPFGIIGILGGPFCGALVGEIITGKKSDKAFRAAFGTFIGFITGTLMKLATSFIITGFFVKEVWQTIFR